MPKFNTLLCDLRLEATRAAATLHAAGHPVGVGAVSASVAGHVVACRVTHTGRPSRASWWLARRWVSERALRAWLEARG